MGKEQIYFPTNLWRLKFAVFWTGTPHSLVTLIDVSDTPAFPHYTLEMEESGYSQMSLNLCQTTRRQSPDSNFRSNRRVNLKSRGFTIDLYKLLSELAHILVL